MKAWALAVGLVGSACALWAPGAQSDSYVFLLSGDTDGYLSPCGCTKPMTGGILRRATAIRQLGIKGRTVVLENGQLVGDVGRQHELKAETLAEALVSMGVTAINLGPSDARLGTGSLLAVTNLSQGRLVSGSVERSSTVPVRSTKPEGPFLIGGVSMQSAAIAEALGERAVPPDDAVLRLVTEAKDSELVPVLMLQGTRDEAAALAKKFTELRLIVYRSTGDPPSRPERIGRTLLATPGEKGKHLVRLSFRNGDFDSYASVSLGPEFKDDPEVMRIYRQYLSRVDKEGLLDKLPRVPSKKFAGSAACAKCHPAATKVWKASAHSHALLTLEKEMHGRDPDCVSCHVVGLQSEKGFRSRKLTPALADVGCESCHGPAADHAAKPNLVHLPKAGEKACMSCHVTTNSPNFNFKLYWSRIKH